MLYGFSSASSMGWTSPVVFGCIIAGVACLVLFARRQLRLEDPLLDLRCLKSSDFAVAAIVVTLINAACLVTNTILPILLQTAMGATALQTGMAMLPAAAVGILISPISGVVFDKFGPTSHFRGRFDADDRGAFRSRAWMQAARSRWWRCCAPRRLQVNRCANMPVNTWGINALENSQIAHGNAIANTGRQVAGGLRDRHHRHAYDNGHLWRGSTRPRNRRGDGCRHERSLYGMRRYRLGGFGLRRAEDPRCKGDASAASCDSRHCRRALEGRKLAAHRRRIAQRAPSR